MAINLKLITNNIITRTATFLPVIFSVSMCYAEDCTYDQSAQIMQLQTIAKQHPGGVIDKESNTIHWGSTANSASSVTYGGCDHLGFTVTKNITPSKKLSEPEVLALAIVLAKEYWELSEAKALVTSVSAKAFTREIIDGSVYFNIPNEYYFEFYIEHNPLEGHVSIVWARNF